MGSFILFIAFQKEFYYYRKNVFVRFKVHFSLFSIHSSENR